MRYLPVIALVVVPLVVWPSIWTLFAVLGLALPVALELTPEEPPRETDPAIWSPDIRVRSERLAAAKAKWKQLHSPWRWR
jgi:hypothetical protein